MRKKNYSLTKKLRLISQANVTLNTKLLVSFWPLRKLVVRLYVRRLLWKNSHNISRYVLFILDVCFEFGCVWRKETFQILKHSNRCEMLQKRETMRSTKNHLKPILVFFVRVQIETLHRTWFRLILVLVKGSSEWAKRWSMDHVWKQRRRRENKKSEDKVGPTQIKKYGS